MRSREEVLREFGVPDLALISHHHADIMADRIRELEAQPRGEAVDFGDLRNVLHNAVHGAVYEMGMCADVKNAVLGAFDQYVGTHPRVAAVVSDEEVEAAAIRLCAVMYADPVCHDEDGKPSFVLWDDASETARNEWRNQAREVLTASRGGG